MARRKLLIRIALVLAALPAAELIVRVATDFDSVRAREEIDAAGTWMRTGIAPAGDEGAEASGAGGLRLHPYYAFDDEAAHDDFAISPKYFALPVADETFDVLVLGGSVAAGFGLHGWPRLERELSNGLGGRKVRLFRHGRAGFKQPQQLMLLGYLFTLGFEPDAVVNLDGFNEVALGLANARKGAHPLYPSVSHWGRLLSTHEPDAAGYDLLIDVRADVRRARELADAALARGDHSSALLAEWTLARLAKVRTRGLARYDEFLASVAESGDFADRLGPDFDEDTEAVLASIVAGWVRASRAMHGLCADRGIPYLHVLQPTLHDEGSKPLTEDERASSAGAPDWIEGVQRGYPLLRAAASDLRGQDIRFLDASRLFASVDETLYYDVCHFLEPGHELLAEAVAAEVLGALPAEWSSTWR